MTATSTFQQLSLADAPLADNPAFTRARPTNLPAGSRWDEATRTWVRPTFAAPLDPIWDAEQNRWRHPHDRGLR